MPAEYKFRLLHHITCSLAAPAADWVSRFCTGGMTEREAFLAAVATWPAGVRPVVHWSESQEKRRPHAHSDYVEVRGLGCWARAVPAHAGAAMLQW